MKMVNNYDLCSPSRERAPLCPFHKSTDSMKSTPKLQKSFLAIAEELFVLLFKTMVTADTHNNEKKKRQCQTMLNGVINIKIF